LGRREKGPARGRRRGFAQKDREQLVSCRGTSWDEKEFYLSEKCDRKKKAPTEKERGHCRNFWSSSGRGHPLNEAMERKIGTEVGSLSSRRGEVERGKKKEIPSIIQRKTILVRNG